MEGKVAAGAFGRDRNCGVDGPLADLQSNKLF